MPKTRSEAPSRGRTVLFGWQVPMLDSRDIVMFGGVSTLAVISVIDWPVAALAAATYALARNGNGKNGHPATRADG